MKTYLKITLLVSTLATLSACAIFPDALSKYDEATPPRQNLTGLSAIGLSQDAPCKDKNPCFHVTQDPNPPTGSLRPSLTPPELNS